MLSHTKALSSFAVRDVQPAKTFYTEILGLQVVDNPMGLIELKVAGSNNIIIYPKPDHTPATFTVLNFLVENIDEAVDQLRALGVTFQQYGEPIKTDAKGICRNPSGPAIAWFTDPSGNILSVLENKS